MFLVQLVGAVIILVIETFNKIEFYQPTMTYYYRLGTSAKDQVNRLIPIETESSIIYQMRRYFKQPNQIECQLMDTFFDQTHHYLHSLEGALKVHVLRIRDSIFVSIITKSLIFESYRVKEPSLLDVEDQGYNRRIQAELVLSYRLGAAFVDLTQTDRQDRFMIESEDAFLIVSLMEIQMVAFRKEIRQFQLQNLNYYYSQRCMLVVSSTYRAEFLSFHSNNSVSENQTLQPMFYKTILQSRCLAHIPIRRDVFQFQINFISVCLDDSKADLRLVVTQYQMHLNPGQGVTSSILFETDVTKYMTYYYRKNIREFIRFAYDNDEIYLILGNKLHLYLSPMEYSMMRFYVVRLHVKAHKNYNESNRITKVKLFKKCLIVQVYDFATQAYFYYYLNTMSIPLFYEHHTISFFKLEDYKQTIEQINIADFLVIEQNSMIEVLYLLHQGDILIGNIQSPIYMIIYDFFFGNDSLIDDISKLRSSTTFWFCVTILLLVVKIYPYMSVNI